MLQRLIVVGVLLGLVISFGLMAFSVPKTLEYNLGACGNGFTVQHIVLNGDKLTFSEYLTDPETITKDDDPFVFTVKQGSMDKNGDTPFEAHTVYKEKQLALNGIIRDDKMIAILTVDGELGHVFYGHEGVSKDMPKDVDEYGTFCVDLHAVGKANIPTALKGWLSSQTERKSIQ